YAGRAPRRDDEANRSDEESRADDTGAAREGLRRARSATEGTLRRHRRPAARRGRPSKLDERTQWSVRSPNGELRDAASAAHRGNDQTDRTAKERLRRVEKSLDHGRQGPGSFLPGRDGQDRDGAARHGGEAP